MDFGKRSGFATLSFTRPMNLLSSNLCKLGCLRELARRNERLQLLETLCTSPKTDPVFWQYYGQELKADARQHRAAATWVRWALRYRPNDPALLGAWADLLWDQREF